jgi:steroid 5-alpha reductase family enzyme
MAMTFFENWIVSVLVILGYMTTIWVVSLALHNSSIVDIFWGAGFVFIHWVYFVFTPDGFLGRKLLLGLLITIWGLRLSFYILRRNWGKPEDFRYQKWRQEAGGKWWWQSYFKVFVLQGFLLWIISTPLLAAQFSPAPAKLSLIDFAALAVWGVGFFFEAVGDWQLARFRVDPANKGKVMRAGVWRYTRHPNYFGDATQWWGYYLFALAAGGWWTIFSPVLMTYLLRRVSGVALLEKSMVARPGYKEYVESTSAFLPWFPRKSGEIKK